MFVLSVDDAGVVTLDQREAVRHDPDTGPDQPVSIAANLITLTGTATDGDGDSASHTLQIGATLVFEDDAPIAVADDAGIIAEDAPFIYNVLANDTQGADGATLVSASLVTGGAGAVTGVLANGNITFDPAPGFAGPVTINYTIRDADGDESVSTLTLLVAPDSVPSVTVVTTDGVVTEAALVPDGSGIDAGAGLTANGSLTITHSGTDTTALLEVRDFIGNWIDILANGTPVQGQYGLLSVNLDGTWSYLLSDNTTNHTDTETVIDSDRGTADQVFDNFAVRVTDTDGDVTDTDGVSAGETITIAINDDGPTATLNTNSVVEGGVVTGNVLTDGADDVFGADGAATTAPAGGVTGVAAGSNTAAPVSGGLGTPGCGHLRLADAERGRQLQLRRRSERGSACGRDRHVRVHDHRWRRRHLDGDADDHAVRLRACGIERRPDGERGCACDRQQSGEHGGDGERHGGGQCDARRRAVHLLADEPGGRRARHADVQRRRHLQLHADDAG